MLSRKSEWEAPERNSFRNWREVVNLIFIFVNYVPFLSISLRLVLLMCVYVCIFLFASLFCTLWCCFLFGFNFLFMFWFINYSEFEQKVFAISEFEQRHFVCERSHSSVLLLRFEILLSLIKQFKSHFWDSLCSLFL